MHDPKILPDEQRRPPASTARGVAFGLLLSVPIWIVLISIGMFAVDICRIVICMIQRYGLM
jgi:hypothetical protein